MALLEEQFTESESLDAGATPIKYEGDVERQREIAEQLWAQLNPQQQMEFGTFEQFFSSGAWKKVLEMLMQQQRGEGQNIMEGEGSAVMEQGMGMQAPALPPTPSPMVNPGAGAAAPGLAGGMGQKPIMPQPRPAMARGGIAELFEEEEIEEPGFDEIEEEEVIKDPDFRKALRKSAMRSLRGPKRSRRNLSELLGIRSENIMTPMRGTINRDSIPQMRGGQLPLALAQAGMNRDAPGQIRTGTGGAPVMRPQQISHDPGDASSEAWFNLWKEHPMGGMFQKLEDFISWYLDTTDYDPDRMAEGGRIGFGLGSFVKKAFKKAKRAVKKIVKSPVGKALLIGGGLGLAGMGPFAGLRQTAAGKGLAGFFGQGSWNPLSQAMDVSGPAMSKFGSLISKFPGGIGGAGLAASMAAPFLFPNLGKPKEVEDLRSQSPDINLDDIRGRVQAAYQEGPDAVAALQQEFPYLLPHGSAKLAEGGRIGAQEGGLMDLGGMEKDYRQEGGFVPLGGEEKADDVPARLSKNEFVFTADAVRSAGGGDIDQGAEVMENVMENLEQGGQISEESQGLEGARDMFATSERLSEVV